MRAWAALSTLVLCVVVAWGGWLINRASTVQPPLHLRLPLHYPVMDTSVRVPGRPSGPPTPPGGWNVAFADGFGVPIVDGRFRESKPTRDAAWSTNVGNKTGNAPGYGSNELGVYKSSQVFEASDGLHLRAAFTPGVSRGCRYPGGGGTSAGVCNYTSGTVNTGTGIYSHCRRCQAQFRWKPGGGETWAFEMDAKYAPGFDGGVADGGNDEGWWTARSSSGGRYNELDFPEHLGWTTNGLNQRSCVGACAWATHRAAASKCTAPGGAQPCSVSAFAWLYDRFSSHTDADFSPTQFCDCHPDRGFHRYTLLILPDSSFSIYMDGRLVGHVTHPPFITRDWNYLILSYALRNPAGSDPIPGFSTVGQTRDFVVRSVAVYQANGTSRLTDVRNAQIAPGTTIGPAGGERR